MTFPILVDVDGVMIDFDNAFRAHMLRMRMPPSDTTPGISLDDAYAHWSSEKLRYEIICFQDTLYYRDLPLIPQTIEAIDWLRQVFQGSMVIAVTACGKSMFTVQHRQYQLRHVRLDTIIFEDHGESKERVFRHFTPGYVIDDSPAQLQAAVAAGHTPVVMDHPFNRHVKDAVRLHSWMDLPKLVQG